MTRREAIREAIAELRSSGARMNEVISPIVRLVETEFPEMGDVMTDILCTQVNEVGEARPEKVRFLVRQNLAMWLWIGRRAAEIEAAMSMRRAG